LLSPLLSFSEDSSPKPTAIKVKLPTRIIIPLSKNQNNWNIFATARIYLFPDELFGAGLLLAMFYNNEEK